MKILDLPAFSGNLIPDITFNTCLRPDLIGSPIMLHATLRARNTKMTEMAALYARHDQQISDEMLERWMYQLLKAAYEPPTWWQRQCKKVKRFFS